MQRADDNQSVVLEDPDSLAKGSSADSEHSGDLLLAEDGPGLEFEANYETPELVNAFIGQPGSVHLGNRQKAVCPGSRHILCAPYMPR